MCTNNSFLWHWCSCLNEKMLLRTLWFRLAVQRPAGRTPVCICVSTSVSHSAQKYESKRRTLSTCSDPGIFAGNLYHLKTQQQMHMRHVSSALGGLSSTLLADPGILTTFRSGRKCFYSSDLVKSVLKSSLKPATISGKRIPKGPRTKQPSRTNQPSLKEDKVLQLD